MATKKIALITGCSQGGLGDALARAFYNRGFRVVATARNPKKMAHFADLNIETVVLDVQSEESIKKAVQEVSTLTGGKLDVLVNNSGIGYMMPIADADIARVRQMFDVNVVSNVAVTQSFLPLIIKAAPGSMIVNNTSLASVMSVSLQGIYSGTKAAMSAINDALRVELEPFGVKVIELKTGTVHSRLMENYAEATSAKLPEKSYYDLARDHIEELMTGKELMKGAADPDVWAQQVVSDLTRTNPPAVIWRGTSALMAWCIRTFLPHTLTDSPAQAAGGIDVFKKRLMDQQK